MSSRIKERVADLNLKSKLVILFVLAALIPVAVVSVVSFQRSSSALVSQALSKVEQEAVLTDQDLRTFLGQFSDDLLALSDTPPIQAIIRARDNGGIDPKSDDSFEVWVNRQTQIFAANARNKGFYQQLRYLDEAGEEMVRVDFKNGEVDIVSGTDRLQNKSGSSYFTEPQSLKTGDVSISVLI